MQEVCNMMHSAEEADREVSLSRISKRKREHWLPHRKQQGRSGSGKSHLTLTLMTGDLCFPKVGRVEEEMGVMMMAMAKKAMKTKMLVRKLRKQVRGSPRTSCQLS